MRFPLVLLSVGAFALGSCTARAGVEVGVNPSVVGVEGEQETGADKVFVCHRGRWQEVAAPAADAHGRHGDRVSRGAQQARASC